MTVAARKGGSTSEDPCGRQSRKSERAICRTGPSRMHQARDTHTTGCMTDGAHDIEPSAFQTARVETERLHWQCLRRSDGLIVPSGERLDGTLAGNSKRTPAVEKTSMLADAAGGRLWPVSEVTPVRRRLCVVPDRGCQLWPPRTLRVVLEPRRSAVLRRIRAKLRKLRLPDGIRLDDTPWGCMTAQRRNLPNLPHSEPHLWAEHPNPAKQKPPGGRFKQALQEMVCAYTI
ncbi:hypothetical protein C8Q77DRAFT_286088 [Trametes polyzona]|nr:hypothetical protein C8Q77DRAFT_286088 [Trametes polyzona]